MMNDSRKEGMNERMDGRISKVVKLWMNSLFDSIAGE